MKVVDVRLDPWGWFRARSLYRRIWEEGHGTNVRVLLGERARRPREPLLVRWHRWAPPAIGGPSFRRRRGDRHPPLAPSGNKSRRGPWIRLDHRVLPSRHVREEVSVKILVISVAAVDHPAGVDVHLEMRPPVRGPTEWTPEDIARADRLAVGVLGSNLLVRAPGPGFGNREYRIPVPQSDGGWSVVVIP